MGNQIIFIIKSHSALCQPQSQVHQIKIHLKHEIKLDATSLNSTPFTWKKSPKPDNKNPTKHYFSQPFKGWSKFKQELTAHLSKNLIYISGNHWQSSWEFVVMGNWYTDFLCLVSMATCQIGYSRIFLSHLHLHCIQPSRDL